MESSIKIGAIKRCHFCNKENYVRTGGKCPECGHDFEEFMPNKGPEVIAFLGTAELNRRIVVDLRNKNMIDDF